MSLVNYNRPTSRWNMYVNDVNVPYNEPLAFNAYGATQLRIVNSGLVLPFGVSAERPVDPSNGTIRFNTESDYLEFYANGAWTSLQPILAPEIESIYPYFLNTDVSNVIVATGQNFNTSPGALNVEIIGTASSVFTPDVVQVPSRTEFSMTFDASNSIYQSAEAPFSIKVTDQTSFLSSTLSNVLTLNQTGFFIAPFGPFGPFAVQDPSATFYIQATDTDHSPPDVSFTITSASQTPGGFALTTTNDVSGVFAPPPGSRTSATAGTYNFTVLLADTSGAQVSRTYSLSLSDPTVISFTPDEILELTNTSIAVFGEFFVVDSSMAFSDGVTIGAVDPTDSNNITLTDVSGTAFDNGTDRVVDAQLNNGTVVIDIPNAITIKSSLLSFSVSAGLTSYSTAYTTVDGVISGTPVRGGYTFIAFKAGSGTVTIVGATNATLSTIPTLVVAGGGGGGSTPEFSSTNAGGGGAGGLVTGFNTLATNTSYNVTVGTGGLGNTGTSNGPGQNGTNSVFDSSTAIGGGGGGGGQPPDGNGRNGGSGGGASGTSTSGSGGSGTQTDSGGLIGYGNDGGSSSGSGDAGAGGGGAGGVGGNTGGAGGIGRFVAWIPTTIASSFSIGQIATSTTYFAGGGGGGSLQAGGLGGGGRAALISYTGGGTDVPNAAYSGTPNTGGGGGAGSHGDPGTAPGANGGSGVVVLRLPTYYA